MSTDVSLSLCPLLPRLFEPLLFLMTCIVAENTTTPREVYEKINREVGMLKRKKTRPSPFPFLCFPAPFCVLFFLWRINVRHALALPGHVAMCLGKRQVNISTFVSRFCFFVKRDCIEHRDLAFILGKSALCCSLGEPRFSRDPAVDLKGWMHVLDAAPNASTSPARRPHSPHPRVPPPHSAAQHTGRCV